MKFDPGLFPQLVANGIGTVTDGTGRFCHVSGTLEFNALFNVAELKGTHIYTGEILY